MSNFPKFLNQYCYHLLHKTTQEFEQHQMFRINTTLINFLISKNERFKALLTFIFIVSFLFFSSRFNFLALIFFVFFFPLISKSMFEIRNQIPLHIPWVPADSDQNGDNPLVATFIYKFNVLHPQTKHTQEAMISYNSIMQSFEYQLRCSLYRLLSFISPAHCLL